MLNRLGRSPLILALLVAALAFGMVGCKTTALTVKSVMDGAPAIATAEPTLEETEAPTPEPTAEPTPTPEAEETARAFERGVWTDNVYENKYLNLRFTMPDGFVAATDEEMAAVMEIGLDVLQLENVDELQKKLAMLKTIYDMMASNQAAGISVMVMLENLNLTIGGSSYSETDYAEVLKTQLTTAELSGYKYTAQDGYETTLGGETYYVLPVTIGDGLMNQNFYLRRLDEYMLAIGISYTGGNDAALAEVLDAFTAIDAQPAA